MVEKCVAGNLNFTLTRNPNVRISWYKTAT